jgi:hypothetical protein
LNARGPLGIAAAFFGLFIGGVVVGIALAELFAPGSLWARGLSAFALPVAFAMGLQAWYGLALLGVALRLLSLLLRRNVSEARPPANTPIPGAFAFLPIASAAGAAVGLLVGWLSATHSIWVVTPIYWAVGTLYGLLAWRLARAGFLMPPESL